MQFRKYKSGNYESENTHRKIQKGEDKSEKYKMENTNRENTNLKIRIGR